MSEKDERQKFSDSFNSNTGTPAISAMGKRMGALMTGTSTSQAPPAAKSIEAMQRRLIKTQAGDN